MNFLSVLKKIGAVISWPVTHAKMLAEFFVDAEKDYPATRTALAGLVGQFEALGPDALAAIEAQGLNVPDDIKTGADLKSLFTYFIQTVQPTIKADYTDFKLATADTETSAPDPKSSTSQVSAVPAAAAAQVVDPGPGLHNVVTV